MDATMDTMDATMDAIGDGRHSVGRHGHHGMMDAAMGAMGERGMGSGWGGVGRRAWEGPGCPGHWVRSRPT